MSDSCNPKFKIYDFRIYSLLIPAVLILFALECIYVFMIVPSNIGRAVDTQGPLKQMSEGLSQIMKTKS